MTEDASKTDRTTRGTNEILDQELSRIEAKTELAMFLAIRAGDSSLSDKQVLAKLDENLRTRLPIFLRRRERASRGRKAKTQTSE